VHLADAGINSCAAAPPLQALHARHLFCSTAATTERRVKLPAARVPSRRWESLLVSLLLEQQL
jgi:hypothetical protein